MAVAAPTALIPVHHQSCKAIMEKYNTLFFYWSAVNEANPLCIGVPEGTRYYKSIDSVLNKAIMTFT